MMLRAPAAEHSSSCSALSSHEQGLTAHFAAFMSHKEVLLSRHAGAGLAKPSIPSQTFLEEASAGYKVLESSSIALVIAVTH